MAFFKLGKKKKEEPLDIPTQFPEFQQQVPPAPSATSPIEQVLMMRQQGYTDNQIIQALQSQGYNTNQVYDAINQANLSGGFQAPPQEPEMAMPDYGQSYEQHPQQQQSFQGYQPSRETQPSSIDEEKIQEVAEAIIDEKWEELVKDIKKVIEWKDRTEDRIAKLEQQLIDIRLSIDSLTKGIMAKISSYDQNIVDVGTEVKAMEKVFQKVLPSLTESVTKLDRMAKGYKEPQIKK